MKKRSIVLWALVLLCLSVKAQIASASFLKSAKYLEDPKKYLSKLDPAKVSSGILIDRSIYDDVILKSNGSNLTSVITCENWNNMYADLYSSSIDSSYFIPQDTLRKIVNLFYNGTKNYVIGLFDFKFNRIPQESISGGVFTEGSDFLIEKNSSVNSYSNNRVIAASCMDPNVYGDNINFIVPEMFFLSNNSQQKLKKLEIDFGNAGGYMPIEFDKIITIDYLPGSGYIELKFKLTFEKYLSGEIETLFAHNTIFRTGTSTVPLPNLFSSGKMGLAVPYAGLQYYPVATSYTEEITINVKKCKQICQTGGRYNSGTIPCLKEYDCIYIPQKVTVTRYINSEIEYCFLFSPVNTSGKLRRPFIILDGFDPGNKRNYYTTRYSNPDGLLEKDRDFRGLFEVLNGNPSPWYSGSSDVNLISTLQNDGYDIVFVNFIDGAGDIIKNANALSGFFNNIINSPQFRDNKTEEAVLIGPSMGGLISRYALTTMERNNENHFVKQWLSFDSPHTGAYIPIGLQHSIDFLSKIHGGGIDKLEEAKKRFKEGLEILITPAAKQMLINHYLNTGEYGYPLEDFEDFYHAIENQRYPKYCKNYGLTNGGLYKLYDQSVAEILRFKITGWTSAYAHGCANVDRYEIFRGSRQGLNNDEVRNIYMKASYENGPGGWNSALYALNCNPGNSENTDYTNISRTRANFIPTASALGVSTNYNNVFYNWKAYTNFSDYKSGKIRTPFDEIFGMQENEEHLRISNYTKSYVLDRVLRKDFNSSERPRSREGYPLSQSVKGNVAYVAKDTLKFAGNNHSFSIESGSDVNVRAGKEITFLPGFSIKANSNFSASIENISYNKVLRVAKVSTVSADYSKPSPFAGKVYDYSDSGNPKLINHELKYWITPNPVVDNINIHFNSMDDNGVTINIINILGEILIEKNLNTTQEQASIDLSFLKNGIYFIKVSNNFKTEITKFLKTE